MEESKRQKQVAKLVMEELSDIFQREGINVVNGGLVSISKVSITPDLLEARVFLSLYQIKDTAALMQDIKDRHGELRKQLGIRVRNQLRRVPDIQFFTDDTLDYVYKMESLFQKISEERTRREHEASPDNDPTPEA